VQTRLRYFLFAPWICQAVADKRPTRSAFVGRLRERELDLIASLKHAGPGQGIIGYRAGGRLTRLPTSVYWSGLGVWRIRQRTWQSIDDYRDMVTRRGGTFVGQRDDDGAVLDGGLALWDPDLPRAPEGFLNEDTAIVPTSDEADYLRRRMASTRLGGLPTSPSLLSWMTRDAATWSAQKTPWSGPTEDLPEPVAALLEHARCFSTTVLGAQLLYNLLLAEQGQIAAGMDTTALRDRIQAQLGDWADRISSDRKLPGWWATPNAFWAAVLAAGCRVRPSTRALLDRWITAAITDPGAAIADDRLRHGIRDQELVLKGRYARLGNLAALQSWNGEAMGGGRMNFRWGTVSRFLNDLDQTSDGRVDHAGA
jgi:uncharacterized protein DUF6361